MDERLRPGEGDPRDPAGPQFKFGRMFTCPDETRDALIALGQAMNDPSNKSSDSSITAGYTYLGQFIAHDITFDGTPNLPLVELQPINLRSPQIDLDSLYGLGPIRQRELYRDYARLKEGQTARGDDLIDRTFNNDLPRVREGNGFRALIADPRNDENLAVAQTHVAFIRFHNAIVDRLETEGTSPHDVFEHARKEVIQHFHSIVLEDFLPTLLHPSALECVRTAKLRFFEPDRIKGVFMPLEFSVAAFRFGHSMVRDFYEWNYFQCADEPFRNGHPKLPQLFKFTNFSGNLDEAGALKSDWVIDWRRFFDFDELGYAQDSRLRNNARKIDTFFDFHLDKIPGFPHSGIADAQSAITVRNLLRGYALGLPSGEEVAAQIAAKSPGLQPISRDMITSGPHEKLLNAPGLRGKTPLWYYILKEAELSLDGRLGPVGSCIIAETLVGLIKKSPYSILCDKDWQAKFGARVEKTKTRSYKMIDLLEFADVVDPIGQY